MRFGIVFPGQGSQCVAMGCDVAANSRAARGIFDRAAAVLDYDLLELQREGPEEKLRETVYSQPAIFTTNVALYEAVGDELEPVVTAGHSFGELCSLVAAHSLEFEEALRIVNERAAACPRFSDWRPRKCAPYWSSSAARTGAESPWPTSTRRHKL
jgi:[acyl-carrier-protein] S-malonyltransferase